MSDTLNIPQLAKLAELAINDEQSTLLQAELASIFDMINVLGQHDTTGVMPLSHPLDQTQPLRTDQVTEVDQRQLLQDNAPAVDAGLFMVPQFIETE